MTSRGRQVEADRAWRVIQDVHSDLDRFLTLESSAVQLLDTERRLFEASSTAPNQSDVDTLKGTVAALSRHITSQPRDKCHVSDHSVLIGELEAAKTAITLMEQRMSTLLRNATGNGPNGSRNCIAATEEVCGYFCREWNWRWLL